MRVVVCHPDTIGDVVLRQPLVAALSGAGHEVGQVARPLTRVVAGRLSDGPVFLCGADPYTGGAAGDSDVDEVVGAVREWGPDVLVCPAWQRTRLEERLARELVGAGVVAHWGRLFAPPGMIADSTLDASMWVRTPEELAEVEKHRALVERVLGREVELPEPRLELMEAEREAAGQVLSALGLEAGGYVVACVGHTRHTAVRNYTRWAEALEELAMERALVFIGHQSEAAATEAVVERLQERVPGARLRVWSGADDEDVGTMLGLIGMSAGYVGRDTGPMHVAGALGKRVASVFGGGTWPRFVPRAERSVSVTVGVSCAGCDWRCHQAEAYCITQVPVGEVRRAIGEVFGDGECGRVVRVIESARRGEWEAATARMVRVQRAELLVAGRELGVARARAMEIDRVARAELVRLRAEAARLSAEAESLREELRRAELARADGEAERGRLRETLEAAVSLVRLTQREMDEVRERATRGERFEAELRAELADVRAKAEGHAEWLRKQLDVARGSVDRVAGQRDELLASRWRRLGRGLGLVRTRAWEGGA